ncbi:MAG: SpoIIE family protein phosphatase [Cyanobacteriota bacterium]|nr:SpoIIE family protein phosphatase [Cyanobacteriota bacterium]
MVQTAVRTLLVNQERDPIKFLSTLNQTIYQNLQRMNSDKNLTLALLDYYEGHLWLTGQHEEMVLVGVNRMMERIDTIDLGFLLGLEMDISLFIGQTQLFLEVGDGLVLYTDGIPEAENPAGEPHGLIAFAKSSWTVGGIPPNRFVKK